MSLVPLLALKAQWLSGRFTSAMLFARDRE